AEGEVDAGEVDGILRRPRDHRVLEIGRSRIAPRAGHEPTVIAPGEVGMEDNARAARCRPAHRLRVAPSLVADDDAERYAVHDEEAPRVAGDILRLLLDCDLVLGLRALD